MKIGDILAEQLVVPDLRSRDKEGVLRELVSHVCSHTSAIPVPDDQVLHALLDRERLGSTGVGEGVAIPHAKIGGLKQLVACFGRIRDGVAFDAIDQQPVSLVFVLLVPENSAGAHLKALARISRLLKNDGFRARLLELAGQHALYEAFMEEDAKY